MCMDNSKHGNIAWKKIAWAEETLLFVSVIGLRVLFSCSCKFEKMCASVWKMQGNTAWKKIAWAEGNPPLCLCDWILCIFILFLQFQNTVRFAHVYGKCKTREQCMEENCLGRGEPSSLSS